MMKEYTTNEEKRRLEAEVHYFYTHGGPVMDGEIPSPKTANKKANNFSSQQKNAKPLHIDTAWRQIVKGGLETEITYFYNHGGPAMY